MPNYLISPKDIYSAEDENGHPLEGGQLFTYIAGSSTPTDTWTDASGSTKNSNPVILDARGEARVWLSDELVYKYVLKTSVANGSATIRTTDNIQANNGGGGAGISSVTHSDSLTISLEGLGTTPSPLTADVLISSISANALGITTSGLYVADLSEAIATKLDKVQAGAQSVVSEVELKQGVDITGALPSGLNVKLPSTGYIGNGANPGVGTRQIFGTSFHVTDTNGNDIHSSTNDWNYTSNAGLHRFQDGSGNYSLISGPTTTTFNSLNYKFETVPDGTPSKYYAQDASGNLVKKSLSAEANQISSGKNFGLDISKTGDTEITFSIGEGYSLDRTDPKNPINTVVEALTSFAHTITDLVSPSQFVYLDKNKAVHIFNTQDPTRKFQGLISIGAIGVQGGIIGEVVNLPNLSYSPMSHLLDLAGAVGIIRMDADVSIITASLTLAQGVGYLLILGANEDVQEDDPNRIHLVGQSPLLWVPSTPTNIQTLPTSIIDPDTYLVSGVSTSVPINKWTIQRMFIGANGFAFLFQGQDVSYGSKNAALDALARGVYTFTNHPILRPRSNTVYMGDLIVQQGETNLDNAVWVQADVFGLGASGGSASGGAFLDKVTTDPQNVAGAVTWAGTQTFEVDAVFDAGATFGGAVSTTYLKGDLGVEDVRATTVSITPNDFREKALSASFTDAFEGTVDPFHSIITVRGWDADYASWQLISSASDAIVGSPLYFRTGYGTSWEGKREIWDSGSATKETNGQILQGSVSPSTEGIICDSLKSEGDINVLGGATFGNSVSATTLGSSEFPLTINQGVSSLSAHLKSKGDGYLGWVGTRADDTRRFVFESNTTFSGSNFGLYLYDSNGLNSQTIFKVSHGDWLRFETGIVAEQQILQGTVTDTGEGIICDSLKSEGDTKSASFTLSALNTAPLSATDTGVLGEIRYTADYVYVCTATNTWKRTALTTW